LRVDPGVVEAKREGERVKRIRLLVLLGVIAVALPFGLRTAGATGTTSNSVTIERNAQYDTLGSFIHVGLQVRCRRSALPGSLDVMVSQKPPETPYPVAAGSGLQEVVCDGRTHSVGVTIAGEGFDAGKARAKAILFPPPGAGGTVKTERTINIIVMNQG
jgi:hypothetical protein